MKLIFKIILGIIFLLLVIAIIMPNDNTLKNEEKQETKEDIKLNDDVTNYMRKCTVMEASDLYTQNIESNNVFDDGLKQCDSIRKTMSDEEFIEIIKEDWKNRKDEEIEGHNLEYYLGTLRW